MENIKILQVKGNLSLVVNVITQQKGWININ